MWVQEVWAHPVLWHSAWVIERVQHKDFVDDQVEKLALDLELWTGGMNAGE